MVSVHRELRKLLNTHSANSCWPVTGEPENDNSQSRLELNISPFMPISYSVIASFFNTDLASTPSNVHVLGIKKRYFGKGEYDGFCFCILCPPVFQSKVLQRLFPAAPKYESSTLRVENPSKTKRKAPGPSTTSAGKI